jgi:hypothetical protein
MSKSKSRRMAFYEIGRGMFAQQMQAEFEQAQIVATERNLPVKVTATILISPPDAKDPRFGLVGYKIKAAYPEIKSAVYTTELKDGSIIADADDVAGLIQTKLELFPNEVDSSKRIPFDSAEALPQ